MRVFLDANVLFSTAKSNGAVRRLLQLLVERGHECWVDGYVLAEAQRNLAVKGPGALQVLSALLPYLRLAAAASLQQCAAYQADTAWLPEKDRPVLAAAIRLRCDALVTGDRSHFGAGYGRTFGGVAVHSPAALAQRILAER